MTRSTLLLVFLLSFPAYLLFAQNSIQDSYRAQPICQTIYLENQSFTGGGDSTDINTNLSCQNLGERNSSWYMIHVAEAGNLCISIIPDDPSADFDFALYDITDGSFQDIRTDLSRELVCNITFLPGGCPNVTGLDGQTTPPCGFDNLPCHPVEGGQTLLFLANAYNPTSQGFTLDLSQSTANILSPDLELASAIVNPNQLDQLSVRLSTPVDCQGIDLGDFEIIGGSQTYTLQSITGRNCQVGGNFDAGIQLNISPAISPADLGDLRLRVKDSLQSMCGAILLSDTINITPNLGINVKGSPNLCSGRTITLETEFSGLAGFQHIWFPGSVTSPEFTLTLDQNIQIEVEVYDSQGRLLTRPRKDLEVAPAPIVNLGLDQVVCQDSVFLTVQGGYASYMWSNDQTDSAIWVRSTDKYWVKVQANNGCLNSDTVDIDIDDTPAAAFEIQDDGLNVSFLNSSNDTGNFFWNFGDGNSSIEKDPTHIYNQAGTYTITLLLSNSCGKDSQSRTITISPNGVESPLTQYLHVYPQPVEDQLFLNWKSDQLGNLQLFNTLGQMIAQAKMLPNQRKSIDVSSWESGIYLLVVEVSGERLQQKIMIK